MSPRQLQQTIHSNFSTDTGIWNDFKTGIDFLLTESDNKADFRDHLCREFNKKVRDLGLDEGLYFSPYDGGLRYLG